MDISKYNPFYYNIPRSYTKIISICESKRDRVNFLQSAREGIMLAFKDKLIPPPQFQIEESQIDEPLLPPSPKCIKVDPILCFRSGSTTVSTNNCTNWNAKSLRTELTSYESITSIKYLEEIFDPIKWWGKQSFKFSILSYLSQSFLVIQASSAESERHFSSAGRVTRKDRGRLNPDTVEGLVLLNEALKKKIIWRTSHSFHYFNYFNLTLYYNYHSFLVVNF